MKLSRVSSKLINFDYEITTPRSRINSESEFNGHIMSKAVAQVLVNELLEAAFEKISKKRMEEIHNNQLNNLKVTRPRRTASSISVYLYLN